MARISRRAYAEMYGPTTGDRVHLGDTGLWAEIERDLTRPGDELTTGAGKAMRDGEGFCVTGTAAAGALDLVIQNATVIDAEIGVVKCDIGVRGGRIAGLGKAGNPDIMEGVDPRLVCGPNTTVINGEFYVATPGAVEAHAHFLTPQQVWHALAGGCTTMIGMSPGPHFDVTCSGPETLGRLIRAADAFPINFGFLGRGCSDPGAIEESVAGGALGVKIHEDFGASPAVIDRTLATADAHDFSVHIHTDTLNEFGFCEVTLAALKGRTAHMYHVEGSGGGHAPDILRVAGLPHVLPSSTNPTNPFTPAALEEGVPMTMLCHVLNAALPEDVAFAECRIRPESMAAEDLLHDMGAISIFATDSQGMGRLAENVAKCWQLASVMKRRLGPLPGDGPSDNARILRYAAKLTCNPAIAAGIEAHVGSLKDGRMADIVLWPRASFGAKPALVLKSGEIVWASAGDGAGSHLGAEPNLHRPMWGAFGSMPAHLGAVFVSQLALDAGTRERLGIARPFLPIATVRGRGKADMVRNHACPEIEVDPATFEVRADGRLLTCPPATEVPLHRAHFLR